MNNILILESKEHHIRANIINSDIHFPNCTLEYNGMRHYSKSSAFFSQFDLIVSVLYLSPTCNYIVNKCNQLGVKTLLLTDGIVEWANMFNNSYILSKGKILYHPIYHDYFALMGSLEKKYFNLNNGVKSLNFTPNRVLKDMLKISENSNREYILLTTANNPYFNHYEKSELIKLLLLAQAYIIENKLSYKCRIFDQEICSFLENKDSFIINDIGSDFDTCLMNVSHVITTPSTIVLSAMIKKIPVCQLIYRNSPVFLQSGWALNSIENIDDFFKDFILADQEKINFQNAVLCNYISNDSIISQIGNTKKSRGEYSIDIDNSFFNDKFIFNFEPNIRRLNDIIKLYLPGKIKKLWSKSFKSLR